MLLVAIQFMIRKNSQISELSLSSVNIFKFSARKNAKQHSSDIAKWFEHGKRAGKAPLLPTNTRQARTVCPVMI